MNVSFALLALAISCAAVAVVYAMTGSDETERWLRDSVYSFGLTLGGVLGLALVVFLVARWVG